MGCLSGMKRVAVLLAGWGLLLLASGAYSDTAVTKGSKAAALEACVAPTAEMRRNHMDYLKHDRDKTVHQGIRETRYSLAECVDCHAEKDGAGAYKPVNSEDQFCAGCHEYVAVSLTCFQCHRSTPGAGDQTAAMLQGKIDSSALSLLQPTAEPFSLTREERMRLHAKTEGF